MPDVLFPFGFSSFSSPHPTPKLVLERGKRLCRVTDLYCGPGAKPGRTACPGDWGSASCRPGGAHLHGDMEVPPLGQCGLTRMVMRSFLMDSPTPRGINWGRYRDASECSSDCNQNRKLWSQYVFQKNLTKTEPNFVISKRISQCDWW